MLPKVEPFFRFLITHTMGALACFLSIVGMSTLPGPGRILPLLILLVGVTCAWRYHSKAPHTRDAIVTTLPVPIAVFISFHLFLKYGQAHGMTLDSFAFLGISVLSCATVLMASRWDYWRTFRLTVCSLMVLGPISLRFLQ